MMGSASEKGNLALKPLKKYKVKVIIGPLLKLFEVASELFIPFLVRYIIDNGIANNDIHYTLMLSLTMFGISLLGFAITMVAQYLASRVSSDYGYELKKVIFDKINHLSEEKLNEYGKQKILTIINNDSFSMQNGVMMFMRLLLRPPFLILGSAILSFVIDYRAGLIFLGVTLFSSLVIYFVTKFVNRRYHKIQASLDTINQNASETLTGVRVIHSFQKEKDCETSFRKDTATYKKYSLDVAKINAFINPLTFFFVNMGIVLIVYLGKFGLSQGFLTTGSIVSLVSYLVSTLAALTMFSRMAISLNKASVSMKRINDFLSLEEENPYLDSSKENFDSNAPILEFKDVSFSYPNSGNVLSHISFQIHEGETIGVIGGTGSGKSTIASLINRIYLPKEGEILFRNVKIEDISETTLRNMISYVSQKPSVFSGTIESNISLGEKIDEAKLLHALETALALEYVNQYPDTYHHEVEENGANLSGGQKQRLMIARALYHLKDILILDDSTSALDYLSDKTVRGNLKQYSHLTKIIISQRATTLMDADQIIVLDKGKIAAIGKHEELLKNCELYHDIYQIQKGVN